MRIVDIVCVGAPSRSGHWTLLWVSGAARRRARTGGNKPCMYCIVVFFYVWRHCFNLCHRELFVFNIEKDKSASMNMLILKSFFCPRLISQSGNHWAGGIVFSSGSYSWNDDDNDSFSFTYTKQIFEVLWLLTFLNGVWLKV